MPSGTPQFGLIAEEVAEVNPDLVVRNENGAIYTVRYEAVNAMATTIAQQRKDFQASITKPEATVAQQQKDFQSTAAQQQAEIKALTASLKEQASQIQKVTRLRRVELSKPAPRTVVNNQ